MQCGVSPEYFEQLRAQSQRNLIDFLNVEIQLGFTFTEAAASQRDMGHLEHSRHTRGEAQKAIDTIHHFLDRIASPEVRKSIQDRW